MPMKIHDGWCLRQQQDYDMMMQAVDDLGAAAVSFATNGAQGYQNFIQTRDSFKKMFLDIAQHYRYVEHD